MPDQRSQGDPGITQISELIKLAKRFGLVWTRRPGTVESTSSPYDARQANVVMDGDTGGTTVVSLIGDMSVGQRVMVDFVPPAGNYAVGLLQRGPNDPIAVAATTSTASAAGEVVSLTLPMYTYRRGSAYRAEMGQIAITAAAGLTATFRVRKGTTIAGNLWGQSGGFAMFAGLNANARWVCYFSPTVDVTTQVCLTISIPGPGGSHVGTAVTPRYISVVFAGALDEYPQAALVT